MFKIMDWFPVVFILFKVVVLGGGMFFAVRWHYEQDRKAQKGAVLSRGRQDQPGRAAGADGPPVPHLHAGADAGHGYGPVILAL
ncbi:hypothetical protein [Sphingobium yanoikuyae]|uniref:hypothetical protein n=1 Tax=Sphingobium yanoikuyae TaxID=13690 RepID=UPI0035AFDE33